MATRGHKPKPEYVRYYEAGRSPAIYLIEAGSEIKVGRSCGPIARLKQHHTDFNRRGVTLGRFAVFPRQDRIGLYWLELACINALSLVASAQEGHREFFTGIDYDTALQVVCEALGVTDPSKVVCDEHAFAPGRVARGVFSSSSRVLVHGSQLSSFFR